MQKRASAIMAAAASAGRMNTTPVVRENDRVAFTVTHGKGVLRTVNKLE